MNPKKSFFNARRRRLSPPSISPRHGVWRSHQFRFYASLALAVAMLVTISWSQSRKADAQNTRARVQQDLAEVFTGYDPPAIADIPKHPRARPAGSGRGLYRISAIAGGSARGRRP